MSKCSVSCLCCDQGNLLSDLVVDIVKLGVQKAIAISCRLLPIMIHNNIYYDYIKLVCFLVYYTPTQLQSGKMYFKRWIVNKSKCFILLVVHMHVHYQQMAVHHKANPDHLLYWCGKRQEDDMNHFKTDLWFFFSNNFLLKQILVRILKWSFDFNSVLFS